MTDIEKHKDSEFILFLKSSNIKFTAEIAMIYYVVRNECFICRHNHYFGDYSYNLTFNEYKEHFIKYHASDLHNYILRDELVIEWDSNKILGLCDQLIVLYIQLDRNRLYHGNNRNNERNTKRFRHYADIGNTIIKIMKDYQIPQIILIEQLDIPIQKIGKYTDAAYSFMPIENIPKWLRKYYVS